MKSQVLHTVWRNISCEAAREIWHWSLSGVKGLNGWENLLFSPFTPQSDQCQISPAASPEILYHTVWRTWLFIAYSDERWLCYRFSLYLAYIFPLLRVGRMYFLSLGVKAGYLLSTWARSDAAEIRFSAVRSPRFWVPDYCTKYRYFVFVIQGGTSCHCAHSWLLNLPKRLNTEPRYFQTRSFILTFTELHVVDGDERRPMEVTSNTHFRGAAYSLYSRDGNTAPYCVVPGIRALQ